MVYLDALARVVPVLLLFGLGALLRRREALRPETVGDLRMLVLNLALPSALFLTFLRVSL
jgi:predicted permease